jgi:N-acetylmuramoyl-L-alanine amidase
MLGCGFPRLVQLGALSIAWMLGACDSARGEGAPAAPLTRRADSAGTLVRVEAVARADALALAAARGGQREAPRLHRDAAVIRARLWRLEGREADALEAAELYRAAAVDGWDGACDAAVDLALFEGERRADPTAAYEALYRATRRYRSGECLARARAALTTLAAFSPPRAILDGIDREGAGSAPVLAASVAPPTDDGTVVVPQIRSAPAEPARITNIEHYRGKEAARVVVFVTHPTLFEVGSLPGSAERGPRLFVDIGGASYRGPLTLQGDGIVERVRLGGRGDGTRLVLDLTEAVERKVFYLPEPFRLVIDVSRERSTEPAAVQKGPRPLQRVVLDPGHGGHDPGATGPGGLREKDVALDVAHRAAPLIARELGISTLLTRDSDTFVPLDERVARANAFGADLFVSIHCNASENGASRGVMTFVLDASRDDLAARVAARENAASAAAAVELANALSRVLDPRTMARSSHFAGLLQRAAMASVSPRYPGTDDLGVRSAGFYVLAGAQMPAVLFETSFISHPTEERRLDSADYRQKLADAIVNAVRAFRDGV